VELAVWNTTTSFESYSSPAKSAVTSSVSATAATATTVKSISEALSTSAAPIKDTKPIVNTRVNIGYKKKQADRAIQTGLIVTSKSSESLAQKRKWSETNRK